MKTLNDKTVGGTSPQKDFLASDCNEIASELQNLFEVFGLTPTSSDLNQVGKGIASYVATGIFYSDTGTANNHVLAATASKQLPTAYSEGMLVSFVAGATNTAINPTVKIGSLPTKVLKDTDGTDIIIGYIATDLPNMWRYHSATGTFRLVGAMYSAANTRFNGTVTANFAQLNVGTGLYGLDIAATNTQVGLSLTETSGTYQGKIYAQNDQLYLNAANGWRAYAHSDGFKVNGRCLATSSISAQSGNGNATSMFLLNDEGGTFINNDGGISSFYSTANDGTDLHRFFKHTRADGSTTMNHYNYNATTPDAYMRLKTQDWGTAHYGKFESNSSIQSFNNSVDQMYIGLAVSDIGGMMWANADDDHITHYTTDESLGESRAYLRSYRSTGETKLYHYNSSATPAAAYSRLSTKDTGMQLYGAVECDTSPSAADHLTRKDYVDGKGLKRTELYNGTLGGGSTAALSANFQTFDMVAVEITFYADWFWIILPALNVRLGQEYYRMAKQGGDSNGHCAVNFVTNSTMKFTQSSVSGSVRRVFGWNTSD